MVNKRKKVLFTATVDSHIELFHLPSLKYFKENGYETHVATNGKKKIPYTDKKHTVSFERSPLKPQNLKAFKQLKAIIDNEKFDIIHTHTPMGAAVTRLAARKARKKYGTRVIYTAHGFHFFKGAPLQNWLLYYPVERYMARHTDTLITINKEDYARAKAQFRTSVKYIPGVGIDSKKFSVRLNDTEKSKLLKSLGLKDTDFVLLYPAELNKNKNQATLIKAMEHLVINHPDIHLLLPGKDSMNGFHGNLINEKNLGSNIHLLGFRNDVPQLLQIADVSMSASHREGLPVNIMEAMYAGLPIIVSNSRGNRDLVNDGQNGYVVPADDYAKYIAKIEELYNNKSKRRSMGKASKKMVEPYLMPEIMGQIIKIYSTKVR